MNTAGIMSSSILAHILGVGTWVGRRSSPLGAKMLLWVVAYFFMAHLLLGAVLTIFPELVDPR